MIFRIVHCSINNAFALLIGAVLFQLGSSNNCSIGISGTMLQHIGLSTYNVQIYKLCNRQANKISKLDFAWVPHLAYG